MGARRWTRRITVVATSRLDLCILIVRKCHFSWYKSKDHLQISGSNHWSHKRVRDKMEQSPAQFLALPLICMMAILLPHTAEQLGVIVSPIELVAQSGSNVIAASADDHSTLGSALLLGSDGTGDVAALSPQPASLSSSMPSSVRQSRKVPKPPPFPPPPL